MIICIAKAKNTLQALIGFNDGSKNMAQVIKAIKLIDKELEKHSKSQFDTMSEEQKEQFTINWSKTIDVPSDFYYSRLIDNIKQHNTYN